MRTLGLYGLGGADAVRLTQLRSPGCTHPAALVSTQPHRQRGPSHAAGGLAFKQLRDQGAKRLMMAL